MIFAIDFDGTMVLHMYPQIGPEVPGACDTVRDLYTAGHTIIIWTCRSLIESMPGLREMIAWLDEHKVPFHAINRNTQDDSWISAPKVYADVYIDDRNFGGFPGWDHVRREYLEKGT